MSDIVEKLRERPSRHAAETEDQAKERRQREREEAADTITTLRAKVERQTHALTVAKAALADDASKAIKLTASSLISHVLEHSTALAEEKKDDL
jgi:hypothetical protein